MSGMVTSASAVGITSDASIVSTALSTPNDMPVTHQPENKYHISKYGPYRGIYNFRESSSISARAPSVRRFTSSGVH